MSNLLKAEFYKLFHSRYFWGIGLFNFLLSSILLLDSYGETANLFLASLYNIPLLYFLTIVFAAPEEDAGFTAFTAWALSAAAAVR